MNDSIKNSRTEREAGMTAPKTDRRAEREAGAVNPYEDRKPFKAWIGLTLLELAVAAALIVTMVLVLGNQVNRGLAQDLGALYAAVGEAWWLYKESLTHIEMYDEDGAHASGQGIKFAAKIIWRTIETDWSRE